MKYRSGRAELSSFSLQEVVRLMKSSIRESNIVLLNPLPVILNRLHYLSDLGIDLEFERVGVRFLNGI